MSPMNNDNSKQSQQQQQQPTFNLPSYGAPSSSTTDPLKKKEEGNKFGFGFGEKPAGSVSTGTTTSGFGSIPTPLGTSASSMSTQLPSSPKHSFTSASTEAYKIPSGSEQSAQKASTEGLLSGLSTKPAPTKVDQSFGRSEGISSISSFFNNNVAQGQTSIGLGGYGAEAKPTISPVFGFGEKKAEGKAEPIKKEEPKKQAADYYQRPAPAQPQKYEPMKSLEQIKTEVASKSAESVKKPEEKGFEARKVEQVKKPVEAAPKKPEPSKVEVEKKAAQPVKKQEEKVTAEVKKPAVVAEKPAETKAAPKPKAEPKKKRVPEPSEIRHSTRERKQVRLENIAETTSHHVPLAATSSGHGTKFIDIPHIQHELTKRKSADATVQLLHRLIYGRVGEAGKRKEFLRKFNGFADEKSVEALKEKLGKLVARQLQGLAVLLNLERSGEKSVLITRISEYFHSPKDLGASKPAPRKTAAPAKKKSAASKAGKKKGTVSKKKPAKKAKKAAPTKKSKSQKEHISEAVIHTDSEDEKIIAEVSQEVGGGSNKH